MRSAFGIVHEFEKKVVSNTRMGQLKRDMNVRMARGALKPTNAKAAARFARVVSSMK
jgi:hypothetical protein